jgi:dienelactone hydrolase
MKIAIIFAVLLSFSSMHSQLKLINYADGNQKLIGLSAKPDKALPSKPGVLILPAWKGIDNNSKQSAQELAALGYHAFVADIYGEGNYPADSQAAGKLSGYYKSNIEKYQLRISLALEQLVKAGANPDNIAVIGYCFGGTGALEAARAKLPVKAVVAFHGGLSKDEKRPNEKILSKVLVCHGADDPFVPETEVEAFRQEMKAREADWQLIYYADAVHSFTEEEAGTDKSKGAAYNEKADKRSWSNMLIFFNEVLK